MTDAELLRARIALPIIQAICDRCGVLGACSHDYYSGINICADGCKILNDDVAGAESHVNALMANGHSLSGGCAKCWREAAMIYAGGHGPYESHNAAYIAVMGRIEATLRGHSPD